MSLTRSWAAMLGLVATVAAPGCSGAIDEADVGQDPTTSPRVAAPAAPALRPAFGNEAPFAPAAATPAGATPASPNLAPVPSAAAPMPSAVSGPSSGVQGILDCPTVPYPGTTEATVPLSKGFARACASCHGGSGEGQPLYPKLPGALSRAQFIAKVRAGANNMPAFGPDLIDDDSLGRDFENLKIRSASGGSVRHPSWDWTEAEVAAKRSAGLALWRKPDKDGQACASCHSPDAIDLAAIGYPDAAILRRGTLHLAADDVLKIVDFVHAQRRQFKIQRPCAPTWRVFQPGGEVLAGTTPKEQDDAFSAELIRRGFLVASGKIETVADADKAWAELATLNLRRLKLGIPVPRWTEDQFNGSEHRTINDWIPSVGRMPVGPEWYAKVDAYLADPQMEKLQELLASVGTLTHDGGFGKRPWADGDLSVVLTSKYHLVQLAAHYFRAALTGKPGWLELSESPPVLPQTRGETVNPFNSIGFAYQENHCYNVVACPPGQYSALPPIAKIEFDPTMAQAPGSSGGLNFAAAMQKELTHPWWTLSNLFDPSFGGGRSLVMHYWLEFGSAIGVNFPHRVYHRPFLMAVTMVKRAVALEKNRLAVGAPGVLNGNILVGFENPIGSTIGTTPENTRLISNLMRMTLLRMRRELLAGARIHSPDLLTSNNGMGDWAAGLDNAAKAGKNMAIDVDYLNGTALLARETLGLIRAGKVAP